jgi:hypothetical protein
VKIIAADTNLLPHRERLEGLVPPGSEVSWHVGGAPLDELRDADVYIGRLQRGEQLRNMVNSR